MMKLLCRSYNLEYTSFRIGTIDVALKGTRASSFAAEPYFLDGIQQQINWMHQPASRVGEREIRNRKWAAPAPAPFPPRAGQSNTKFSSPSSLISTEKKKS
jgi:hypothetical protein